MSTPDYVQVPPDGGGKNVDTVEVLTAVGEVQRQVIVLADPADPAGYATILAANPTGLEHALVVRTIPRARTPQYHSGTGGGTVTLPAGVRLDSVSALAVTTDGTFTVAGGDPITVRAGHDVDWSPTGDWIAATIAFSTSLDWIVEGST